MIVKVLYFGRLKELSGSSEESVEVRDGARIEDLFGYCSSSRPELRKFRASLVAARNREFAAWATIRTAGARCISNTKLTNRWPSPKCGRSRNIFTSTMPLTEWQWFTVW